MGNFENAVKIYLAAVYEDENEKSREARRKLMSEWENKDFKEALKYFPRHLGYEIAMLNHLVEKNDYTGALKVLPKKLRMMFIHAYQSFIYNKALSKYMKNKIYVERLPLVGYDTIPDEISAEILASEGIKPENFKIDYLKDLSSKGEIRDCFTLIYDFEILNIEEDEMNAGKNKITIGFSLPKGCYATSLLREFMKNPF